jgi:hypothetical protein
MCTFILYVIILVSGCPNLPAQTSVCLTFYCTTVARVVHRVVEVSGDQTGVTVLL